MRTGQGDGFGRGDGRKLGKADMIVYFVLSHLATHPLSTFFCNCFFLRQAIKKKENLAQDEFCKTFCGTYQRLGKTRPSCPSQEVIKSVLHWSRVERNAWTFWERFFEKRYADVAWGYVA